MYAGNVVHNLSNDVEYWTFVVVFSIKYLNGLLLHRLAHLVLHLCAFVALM